MYKKLRNSTLVFLIERDNHNISQICLALKKRGFGVNRWNGVGGKVEQGESIEEASIREAKEEIGITPTGLNKVAELTFIFPLNSSWNQLVHVYFTENWIGVPKESDEMNPKWFILSEIPYQDMWPDDKFWLPEVLKGNFVKAEFTFGENDIIQKQKIEFV